MNKLPRVVVTDLILEPLECERRVLNGHADVVALNITTQAELAMLPAGSIVVNTARGGVVDTAAVVAALAEGHLCGAGIDVLEQEPPSEDSPVLRAWRDPNHPAHDRLLLNPHTAYYCEQGSEEFRIKGSLEVLRALQGKPLRNCVN